MDTQESKKVIVYIFSGTGNTLIAGEMLKTELRKLNMEADIFRVTSQASTVPDPNNYDLAGFAYPIHAFNAPSFFQKFVKNLPALKDGKKGMPAFIFKTSGEPFAPNHASSYSLCKILRRKGFVPGTDMHMLMPYNIMFRYPDAMAKQMYIHTGAMAEKLARQIAAGEWQRLKFNPVTVCFSYLLRLQWFGAWINGPMITAKKELCISCGKCVKLCPAANIEMVQNAKSEKLLPKFHGKCTMCMGCTMGCPKGAINPGFLTPWKVNGNWNFEKLMADETIPSNWTDTESAGYFKLFRKYYLNN